ncbi:hypothetical protein H072_3304 [Dactylellina haptotyla CBS 200.50]|uniref:C2H2-type domain-containing protein n=1 Tax=Dactylellina haptotyla (strain CBS 200.50) TaxID=1284197 RepID=S8AI13_DACHA|nr:hypothetical protein H072_3304 [Dactylellina haptotyla CBS 200.50]
MAPEPVQVSSVPSITTNGTPPERSGTLATDIANPASPRRSPSPSVLPPLQNPFLPKSITDGLLAAARRSMSPNPRSNPTAEAADDGVSQNPAAILSSQATGVSRPSDAPTNAAPPAPGPKLAPIETGNASRLSSGGPSGPTSAIDALTSPHSATSASAESGLTATAGLGSDTSPTRPRLGSISEALGHSYMGSATPSTPFSPVDPRDHRQSASYPDPRASISSDPRASISSASGSRGKHECPNCHQTFTRHHNLKSHLLTHSHEKPFQCITCQSRFRRLHDLKRHQKLHTGERPHVCDSCGRRFARADALARHNRGEGGCAGRRSSMTGLNDPGYDGVDGMEGIEHTGDDEAMDDYPESPTGGRKAVSLPNARSRHSYSRARAQARQAQNLQPAPLPPRSASNHSYPPINPNLPSGFAAPAPPSINTSQPNAPSILQQGNLTDSPRALSPSNPGFPVPPHDSTSLGPVIRSPSFSSTSFHHQPSLDSNRRQSTVGQSGYSLPQPAQTSPRGHNAPLPGTMSRPGSFSSTHLAPPDALAGGQSNIFNSGTEGIWSYIKELEKRVRELEEKNQNMETKLQTLTNERQSSAVPTAPQPTVTPQESG